MLLTDLKNSKLISALNVILSPAEPKKKFPACVCKYAHVCARMFLQYVRVSALSLHLPVRLLETDNWIIAFTFPEQGSGEN